jgi:mercuric reductase
MATTLQIERQPTSAAGGTNVLTVLTRLQKALPLEKRQRALQPALRTIHRNILRGLAAGKPLRQAEIAAMLGSNPSALHALATLASNDLVILNVPVEQDEKTRQTVVGKDAEIVGAYPLTTENTPHKVLSNNITVNAMCAVDALSISPMFGEETRIESRCHVTGAPIRIQQKGQEILEAFPSRDVRVGIRWQSTKGCAAHTICTEMVFLKDWNTAAAWRDSDPDSIDLLTLYEAVELGTAFFVPLIEE